MSEIEDRMNKIGFSFRAWLVLGSLLAPLAAEASPSAQEILDASDRVRIPTQAFHLTNRLVEYVEGRARDQVVLSIQASEDPQSHQYRNLVRYREPPRDLGKIVLMNGSNMWFYDPASKSSLRISPQQRLVGQASDGDVMAVNLGRDYKPALSGEESLQDADRQERQCWHLDLAAATDEAVYNRVEYWIEKDSYHPIKAKFYADSGRLLKIAYYRKYETQLGGLRPTELVLIDAVNSALVTIISASDFRFQDIPESWYQRDYLPRVSEE